MSVFVHVGGGGGCQIWAVGEGIFTCLHTFVDLTSLNQLFFIFLVNQFSPVW